MLFASFGWDFFFFASFQQTAPHSPTITCLNDCGDLLNNCENVKFRSNHIKFVSLFKSKEKLPVKEGHLQNRQHPQWVFLDIERPKHGIQMGEVFCQQFSTFVDQFAKLSHLS